MTTTSSPAARVVDAGLSDGEAARLSAAARGCVLRSPSADPAGFTAAARDSLWCLPARLAAPLEEMRGHRAPGGGLLIRGLPLGRVPATPARPQDRLGPTLTAAGVLGIAAAALGEQVGYEPQLAGGIFQDVVPVRGMERTQQSVSSAAELDIHVELAFADDAVRADWILLLCLRQDHLRSAGTTLSPVDAMLPLLDAATVATLREPRFRTTVDEAFLDGLGAAGPIWVGPIAVLSGDPARPEARVDFAETEGTDPAARAALARLRDAAAETAAVILMAPGDLLVVDNRRALHGRTPFSPRYDGRDRWLLRASAVAVVPGGGRVVASGCAVGAAASR